MAEAQLTNAASLADSPVHKRPRGRPKKGTAVSAPVVAVEKKPVFALPFLQKEKRPRGRPRIHPPKLTSHKQDPSGIKRPRGRPKTTADKPQKPSIPKGPRGRPKGSKNKIKTGDELVKKAKGPRGRPKKLKNGNDEPKVKGKRGRPKMATGLKVKIVVRKPSTSSAESTTNGTTTNPTITTDPTTTDPSS